MAWTTPSSLKWLIVKRSRLAGALETLDADLAFLREKLPELKARRTQTARSLDAIDIAMGLHEIQIDPLKVAVVEPHVNRRMFPYGELARIVRRALKEKDDWMSTNQVGEIVFKAASRGKICDLAYAREALSVASQSEQCVVAAPRHLN